MLTVNVVCSIHEVETRSISVVIQNYFSYLRQSAQRHCTRVYGRCYTDIVRAKITRDIFGSDYIGPSVDADYLMIISPGQSRNVYL